MNKNLIVSLILKCLPVIAGALVGGGVLDDATGAQLPAAADAIIVLAAFIPTLVRSIKNYKAKK